MAHARFSRLAPPRGRRQADGNMGKGLGRGDGLRRGSAGRWNKSGRHGASEQVGRLVRGASCRAVARSRGRASRRPGLGGSARMPCDGGRRTADLHSVCCFQWEGRGAMGAAPETAQQVERTGAGDGQGYRSDTREARREGRARVVRCVRLCSTRAGRAVRTLRALSRRGWACAELFLAPAYMTEMTSRRHRLAAPPTLRSALRARRSASCGRRWCGRARPRPQQCCARGIRRGPQQSPARRSSSPSVLSPVVLALAPAVFTARTRPRPARTRPRPAPHPALPPPWRPTQSTRRSPPSTPSSPSSPPHVSP